MTFILKVILPDTCSFSERKTTVNVLHPRKKMFGCIDFALNSDLDKHQSLTSDFTWLCYE